MVCPTSMFGHIVFLDGNGGLAHDHTIQNKTTEAKCFGCRLRSDPAGARPPSGREVKRGYR